MAEIPGKLIGVELDPATERRGWGSQKFSQIDNAVLSLFALVPFSASDGEKMPEDRMR